MSVAAGSDVRAGPRFGRGDQFRQRGQQPGDPRGDGAHLEEPLQGFEFPLEKRGDAEGEQSGVAGQVDVESAVKQRVLGPGVPRPQHVEPPDLLLGGNLNLGLVVEPLHRALQVRRLGGSGSAKGKPPLAADHDVESPVGQLMRAAEPRDRSHRTRRGKLTVLAGRQQAEQSVLGRPSGQIGEELTIPGLENVERKQRTGKEDSS